MSLKNLYHAQGHQCGSASVEFALVAPLLITILVFIFDFSRIFFFDMAVSHAARVGAEYGALSNATCSSDVEPIKDIVIKEAQHNGITIDRGQIEPQLECACLNGTYESPTSCEKDLICPDDVPKIFYSNVRLSATFNTVLQGAVTSLLNLDAVEIVRSVRMRCSS